MNLQGTLLSGALLALVVPATAGGATAPVGPGYAPHVTLMMGRAQEGVYADRKCKVPTSSVSLPTTAAYLASKGLRATALAALSQIGETTPFCDSSTRILYSTWSELRLLRDTYAWDVVSHGPDGDNISGETGQQLYNDTCGVLPNFYAHGFPKAWGMFAYPGNGWSTTAQQTVKTCYGYGRQYGGSANQMPAPDPYWQKTTSVNAGLCNDASLACYTDPNVKNARRYMVPTQLAASVSTLADSWTVIQFYRLVKGSQGSAATASGLPAWDCTSADPRRHWSHLPEDYCYADFQAFVEAIPAGVIDASPAEIATLYGRSGVAPGAP